MKKAAKRGRAAAASAAAEKSANTATTPPASRTKKRVTMAEPTTPPTVERASSSAPTSPARAKRRYHVASTFAELSRTGTTVLRPLSPVMQRAAKTVASRHELVMDASAEEPNVNPGLVVLDKLKAGFRSLKTLDVHSATHHWAGPARITTADVLALCRAVTPLLLEEPTLVHLPAPAFIVGDLHGNYRDLKGFAKALFPLGIALATAPVLFLGDYVDRGPHSVEVALNLLALKAVAPSKVTLLRGNHEDPEVNGDVDSYGEGSFRTHCLKSFGTRDGDKVWNAINDAFAALPLAAIVDNNLFCVHGGLPRALETSKNILRDILAIERPLKTVEGQLELDLLWSDPVHSDAEKAALGHVPGFGAMFGPSARGPDVATFGADALDEFFRQTGCSYLIRAHERVDLGFGLQQNARVVTVFSSSSYAGSSNQAAICLVQDGKIRIILTKKET